MPEGHHLDDDLDAEIAAIRSERFDDDLDDDLGDDLLGDLGEPARQDGDISPQLIELEKIPRRLWEQTLAPWHPQLRMFATLRIPDERLREQAQVLAMELNNAEWAARVERDRGRGRARRTAAPLPTPDAVHASAQATRQVGLRLRRDDYARLEEAARAVGLKPTTLARALVLNGADKILRERGAT